MRACSCSISNMRSPRQDPAASIQGIITDIRFGEPPDGWDVARVAREIDSEMPIVYVSGDSAPDWASKGVPNSLILAKPFAMAQLVTAISQLLNVRRPENGLERVPPDEPSGSVV